MSSTWQQQALVTRGQNGLISKLRLQQKDCVNNGGMTKPSPYGFR
jgi:hypothetical protein